MAEGKCTCTILFFASAAEAVGLREKTVLFENGSTLGDVIEHLVDMFPALASIQQTCAFALNEMLVQPDTEISDGCTIAVLPPVSGG